MFVRIVEPTFEGLLDNMVPGVFASGSTRNVPAVDIAEFQDRYEIVSELPGLKREDVKISVQDGMLMISGERKHYGFPEGTTVVRHETRTEPFSRSFDLPDEVDVNSISAELQDGILRVQLPKAEKARPREISIR